MLCMANVSNHKVDTLKKKKAAWELPNITSMAALEEDDLALSRSSDATGYP